MQNLNPLQAQVANQSNTKSTEPGTTPAETLSASQSSSQALVATQYRTPTLVQNQEQVPAQPGNQNGSVVGAPVTGDSLNPMPAVATAQSGQLTPIPLVLGKPASTAVGKTLTTESIRGNANSVQQVSHLIAGQSTVPAVDASAMARVLAVTGGTVSTATELAGVSSAAISQQDTRETFATLDTAIAPRGTTWIQAGTQRAEAGFQDPALGWVSVRANLSGGGVHAQLVPDSADAAQALSSHLAGLNAYLVEHHTPVETLTLTAPESGWSGLGSGRSAGEGMQQGSGQQTSQGADASLSSASNPESVIQSSAPSLEPPVFFGDMNGSEQATIRGGFHISVMA
ncbi:MAG TPA: flagellar hook-length control protein FliK [Terracidiphilus sp.]|nr:flagellar hook-length control protein FliK [Terracidiphilus sp.]